MKTQGFQQKIGTMDEIRFEVADEMGVEFAEAQKFVSLMVTVVAMQSRRGRQDVVNAMAKMYRTNHQLFWAMTTEMWEKRDALKSWVAEVEEAARQRRAVRAQQQMEKLLADLIRMAC